MTDDMTERRLTETAAALAAARARVAAVFDEALGQASALSAAAGAAAPRLRTKVARLLTVLQDADAIDQRFDHLLTALRHPAPAGSSPAARRVLADHVASLGESCEEAADLVAATLRDLEDAADAAGVMLGADARDMAERLAETADTLGLEAGSLHPLAEALSPQGPREVDAGADLAWLSRLYTTEVERAVHRRAVFARG